MAPNQQDHLARSFEIFKSMVDMADLVVVSDVLGNMRVERMRNAPVREDLEATQPSSDLPFGSIWRKPADMLNTLHYAIYAMNRAARKDVLVTTVYGRFNGDSDVDPAVNVYQGLLEDEKAIQRAAKDLAKEFGEGINTESILSDWTFTVHTMKVMR